MSLDILRIAGATERIAPVEARLAPLFCLVLLAGGCALASLVLACATPFAAFAVIGAAMLPLPRALVAVTAAWLVNQAIGFGVLGYPHELNTLLWGVAIGLAAVLATVAAKSLLRVSPRVPTPLLLVVALVGAYAAYEVVLFAFTPLLGGAGAFTAAIVARLGILNLLWMIGLVVVCAAWRLAATLRHRLAMS
jgi:hypothetical protein